MITFQLCCGEVLLIKFIDNGDLFEYFLKLLLYGSKNSVKLTLCNYLRNSFCFLFFLLFNLFQHLYRYLNQFLRFSNNACVHIVYFSLQFNLCIHNQINSNSLGYTWCKCQCVDIVLSLLFRI